MLSTYLKGASSIKDPIQVVSSIAGSALSSGVTSVVFSGHQIGDWLVAIGGGQTFAEPTFTAGWTRIVGSQNGGVRSAVAVYKIATTTANETVTFTSSGNSIEYSAGLIVRNVAGVGATASTNGPTGTVTSTTVPALSLLNTSGTSLVIAGMHNRVISSISGSPAMTINPTPTPGLLAYLENPTSFPSRTAFFSALAANVFVSFELLF